MARLDPHSYNDSQQPETAHLDWRCRVDFETRTLAAEATLRFRAPGEGPLDLDTRELDIDTVSDLGGASLPFTLGEPDAVMGQRLRISLRPGTEGVRIRYRTRPTASALQWLAPEQTAGKTHPYLFSQCQAIHARSMVPIQDTPRIRIPYRAELDVPAPLRGLMAAAHEGREVTGPRALERYGMPQPVPPYLLALAVGDLASRELGPRSRVWAEPSVVDAAAYEFAQVDDMLKAAEALFGPYDWERFDLLTMPPSFPYGGMENPRLTFLTPTLLAGDRSLVNVVAHELAHSWTGNLVSNASAEHFWLNEGFTVYAERRILEALEGRERAELHAALGRRSLEEEMQRFQSRPELTKLQTSLTGVDPDDAYSQVPYEKGYLLLRALEEAVGRETFDRYLRGYLSEFRFQAITTETFVAYTERTLPGALTRVKGEAYLHQPGIPASAPRATSYRLDAVFGLAPRAPLPSEVADWTPVEWQLYLEHLPRPADTKLLEALDGRFALTRSRNNEVLVSWLELCLRSGWMQALPRATELLGAVGRMKYLRPIYGALASSEATRPLARTTFERYQGRYHPIAAQLVRRILEQNGA